MGSVSTRKKNPPSQFKNWIGSSSKRSKSRLVLSLDLDFRENAKNLLKDAKKILVETSDYICAVKLNFHLIVPLSLAELSSVNSIIGSYGLPSIADIKLNDIGNTNRVATEYLWLAGFSAVIVNPLVGYEGALDVVLSRAQKLGKGVITLAFMSHKGAEEGYGLVLKDGRTLFELFLDRAKEWNVDGIIVGSTRTEKIERARIRVGEEIKIFSPGSGAQGGDALSSLNAGSDYLIVGRSIVDSQDPRKEAKRMFESLLPWTDTH
jgi:orotidine-5'-phosphate decarboxylase